jgi:methylase of polypeptide subunit release factors
MPIARKLKSKVEFGDFQTPVELAVKCCKLLAESGLSPASILEPTCGRGNFLAAALQTFPAANRIVGVEINLDYIQEAQRQIERFDHGHRIQIIRHNFFHADWRKIVENLPDPLLIVGNPPWVTNSQLGSLESDNLPGKTNFHNFNGLDALTGKSNFDISEWMLLRALEWINGRGATLAVLCKTAVARKVLSHAWKQGFEIARASLYRIMRKNISTPRLTPAGWWSRCFTDNKAKNAWFTMT